MSTWCRSGVTAPGPPEWRLPVQPALRLPAQAVQGWSLPALEQMGPQVKAEAPGAAAQRKGPPVVEPARVARPVVVAVAEFRERAVFS